MAKPSLELLKAGVKAANKSNKQLAKTPVQPAPKVVKASKQPGDAAVKNAEQRLAIHSANVDRLMKIPMAKRTAEDTAELQRAVRNKEKYTGYLVDLRINNNPGKLPAIYLDQAQ